MHTQPRIIFLALLLCAGNTCHALSNLQARLIPAAIMGALSTVFIPLVANNLGDDGAYAGVTLLSAVTAGIGMVTHKIATRFTPTFILSQTEKMITATDSNLVRTLGLHQADREKFLATVNKHYISSDTPLMSAYLELKQIKADSIVIRNQLRRIIASPDATNEDKERAHALIDQFTFSYFSTIDTLILFIKQDPGYSKQLGAVALSTIADRKMRVTLKLPFLSLKYS
jgi:hypothetical protein